MKKFNYIDLFAGCGGLSEGFNQQGYYGIAHVEWESPMVNTLRNRLVKKWGYTEEKAKKSVIKFDIQKTDELIHGDWSDDTKKIYLKDNSLEICKYGLNCLMDNTNVDVIIGGPPCQAYSIAGRAQDPKSMKDDYRNYLFESFVKVVDYYQPKVFVFENVPGILSAAPGNVKVINRIYESFSNIGYEIRKPDEMKKSIYSSADYYVPQDRKRVIIFGVKKSENIEVEELYHEMDVLKMQEKILTVKDVLYELPKFVALEKPYKNGRSNISHKLVGENSYIQHIPRYVNKKDQIIYKEWVSKCMNKISNSEKLDYYYKMIGKKTNHNKYRSLEWDKPSPTIVSHLNKDGHMFIHPDAEQARSITIREAAILQSFPNDFEFIGSNSYCYKMIGNAVPVNFAKKIAEAVENVLSRKEK